MKNYIILRDNLKQDLKRLFPLLLGKCDDALKPKLHNKINFKALANGGRALKLVGDIKWEGYGLI